LTSISFGWSLQHKMSDRLRLPYKNRICQIHRFDQNNTQT
jgi:hypothetical protein